MFTGDEMEKIGLTLMRTYEISPMKVFSHNIDGTISKEGFRVEWRDG
jgi:hypothetical protein